MLGSLSFQAGRAEAAKKAMAKLKSEGMIVKKPFIEKKRRFEFPDMGKSGRIVARCENLVCTRRSRGYCQVTCGCRSE